MGRRVPEALLRGGVPGQPARLAGAAAALACTENQFRIDTRSPELLKGGLGLVARLVSQVPVFRIRIPSGLEGLPGHVREASSKLLEATA